ncbi:MAG: flagellar hook-length control protein FliK [Natronospirillum sp.]
MAKIDSIGKMRLPPDSALRPQAYSERERASSEPTRRALTDWFQVVQQQRQGQTDQALVRAIEAAIGPRVDNNQQAPRSLPMTVISALEPTQPGRHEYQVQLGQQVIRISSGTVLEAGQTLLLIPSTKGPQILVPSRPEQQIVMLDAAQRQQLSLLPALQVQSALVALKTLLPDLLRTASTPSALASTPSLTPPTAAPSTTSGAIAAPGNLQSNTTGEPARAAVNTAPGTTPEALQITALRDLITRWVQAMPTAVRTAPTAESTLNPATPTPLSASGLANVATTTGSTLEGSAAVKNSQHWISQLITTAQDTYGKTTPETVRAVWTQWQQGAQAQLQLGADSTRLPATTDGKAVSAGAQVASPPNSAGVSSPVTGNSASGSTTKGSENNPLLQLPVMRTSPKAAHAERPPLPPPADWWRVVAEQVIDQRLLQQGVQAPQLTLQEQLKQRAQDILARSNTLYSPDQMRQSLAPKVGRGPENAVLREQQTLLAIRQTLEQVAQQHQVRTLLSLPADQGTDGPRLLQGIPVWSDQHLVWFDVERHPPEDTNEEASGKSAEWVLDVHFHLAPMAPICARMHWRNNSCSLHFLTDDAPTLRAIHDKVSDFSQRLTSMGLPVEDVQCRHGLPKRVSGKANASNPSQHQVDIRT